MNTFGDTKSKNSNPKNIFGGIPDLFDEADFEREGSAISAVASGVGGVFESLLSLGQDITGVESKKETNETEKFPSKGSIEFNKKQIEAQAEQLQKQQAEINRKKDFYQALEKGRDKVQREKDQLFEEEINDIAANLPTEQKNQLLGYQASYRDRSVYQQAELRKKLIEQRKQAEKQQEEAEAPQAKTGFNVGENELLMGGERSGGGHWSTTPG